MFGTGPPQELNPALGLSVPHLMCWRTERTATTARRCCGVLVIPAPDTKLQTYLLTYLLTYDVTIVRFIVMLRITNIVQRDRTLRRVEKVWPQSQWPGPST